MKTVKFSKQAAKTLRKMPVKSAKKFHNALSGIAVGKFENYKITVLGGKDKGRMRIRVGGMRAVMEWRDDGNTLMVLRIKPRGEIYKQRKRR